MNERLTTAVYPVILSRAEDGITITFPDLPGCISCAQTDAEAIFMARDALGAWGVAAEDLGEPVPSPTAVTALRPEPNETVCLVDAWLPIFREGRVIMEDVMTYRIISARKAVGKEREMYGER